MIKGFDGSHYQKVSDWNAVKNDGIQFVFLKATEGTTYIDPTFEASVAGARAVGLEVGAYHFARFGSKQDAINEANWFIKNIQGKDLTLSPTLDLEVNDSNLSKDQMNECVNAFVDIVKQATGQKVIIYTFKNFLSHFDRPADTMFWYARYGVQAPDMACDFWQYADNGQVAGVSGNVDMDYFMGDVLPVVQHKVEAVHETPVTPPVASAPVVAPKYYTIKAGDTFSGIASRLGINAQELMNLNPTVKPRGMQIGAVLVLPTGHVVPTVPKKEYVQLPATADTWRIYKIGVAPVKGKEFAFLHPSKFGGLTYEILGKPQADVYTIQTSDYGKVNIYATTSVGAKFFSK